MAAELRSIIWLALILLPVMVGCGMDSIQVAEVQNQSGREITVRLRYKNDSTSRSFRRYMDLQFTPGGKYESDSSVRIFQLQNSQQLMIQNSPHTMPLFDALDSITVYSSTVSQFGSQQFDSLFKRQGGNTYIWTVVH